MIIYSPDGTTKEIPNHSYTWKDSMSYMYGVDQYGTKLYSTFSGYSPCMHTSVNNSGKLACAMPASLMHYYKTNYSSDTHQPSYPYFQSINSTVKGTQIGVAGQHGYSKFYPQAFNPFNPSFPNVFSSHLICGYRIDGSDTSVKQAYIQPAGVSNGPSVVLNACPANTFSSVYNFSGASSYINNVVDDSTTNITSYDKTCKVLTQARAQSPYPGVACVSVNFLISIKTKNFDMHYSLLSPRSGVYIPVYYARMASSSNPTSSYNFEDAYQNNVISWNGAYLQNSIHRFNSVSTLGLIRLKNYYQSSTGDGRYYMNSAGVISEEGHLNYTWLSGNFTFEIPLGYGCSETGYTSITVGSPIVSFRYGTDYQTGDGQYSELFMAYATSMELWGYV